MPTGILGTPMSTEYGTRNNRYQPGILPGHSQVQDFLLGRGNVDITRFADAFNVDLHGLSEIARARAQGARAEMGGLIEAANIRDTTEARREQTLGYLQDEQARASEPTLSQETIDRMFGSAADKASADTEALMRSLRAHLGQSGAQGGVAHGLAAGIEMSRLGQLTSARRDLSIYKAQADAQDRLNRWQRAFQIGEVMNQEPSAFLYDALQNVQEAALVREGLQTQREIAERTARAQESAGEDSMFGSILGGVFGLAGAGIAAL